MKPPNFSVIKKRFKKECFLTLLYDEWKPVSLNKLKFCRRGGKKASFCVKKEAFHEIMLRKSGTESHNIRRQHVLQSSAPLLLWVLFSSMIDFVYHLSRCNQSFDMRSDLCSCIFRFASRLRFCVAPSISHLMRICTLTQYHDVAARE